jgi:hypothetical protein
VTGVLVAAAAAAAVHFARPARAASSATGELTQGGTALGDVSKSAGETDVIGVDLEQGANIDVRWTAGFDAAVSLLDPDGHVVPLGLGDPRSSKVLGWTVPATGHWRFQVSSSDGTQGNYRLIVTPKWRRTIAVAGVDATTFDVPMPAGGFVRGVLRAARDASFPEFLSFRSPGGVELLPDAVHGPARAVRWKGVATTESGVHKLTAAAGGASRAFTGTLIRRAPRFHATRINLRNGIDSVSYLNDGVADYFKHSCAPCHDWATTYSGTRGYASTALSSMRSGQMPLGGPPAGAATLELVSQWILTGYAK